MAFTEPSPGWQAPGTEPPESKKQSGWVAGEKPPADYFNWFMAQTSKNINEIHDKAAEKDDLKADKIALSNPDFPGATNINEGMTQLKQSVSNGKALVAGAITDKGVPTSPSDTFQQMADNIGAIETDKTGDATATAADIISPKTAYAKGQKLTGTMPNRGVQTITPGAADKAIPDGYIAPGSKVVGDPDLIPGNIRSGKDIFGVVGNVIEALGDAAAGDVLAGKTFSKAGQAGIAGTMPNNGAVGGTITQQGGRISIPRGFTAGGDVVAQFANLLPQNVRQGVNIGGVVGSLVEGKKFYYATFTIPPQSTQQINVDFTIGAAIAFSTSSNDAKAVTFKTFTDNRILKLSSGAVNVEINGNIAYVSSAYVVSHQVSVMIYEL